MAANVNIANGGGTYTRNFTTYGETTNVYFDDAGASVKWSGDQAQLSCNRTINTYTTAEPFTFTWNKAFVGTGATMNYSIDFDKDGDPNGWNWGTMSGTLTARPADTAITATPSSNPASSGTVTIGSGSSYTTYRVVARANSSDNTITSGTVGRQRTGNGDINLDTVFPGNQGEVGYYKIQAKVTNANGGNNTWVETTGDTFNFTRSITSVPTSLTVTDDNNNGANVIVTLTAGGTVPTGCVREYSKDGTTWQSSNTFTVARSQTKTYYCRYNNDGVVGTARASAAYSPGYISPDLGISNTVEQNGSAVTFNIISGVSNVTAELTGLGTYNDYRIVVDAASSNGSVASNYGTVATSLENGSRTSASMAIAGAALPDIYGELAYFRIDARRPTDRGGDGVWTDCSDDFEIAQAMLPLSGTLQVTYGSEVAPTVTATIGVKTPATGCIVEYTATGTAFWTTSRDFAVTRGASNTYQARNTNTATGVSSSSISITETAPLVGPDTSITATTRQNGSTVTLGLISGTSNVTTYCTGLGAYTDYRILVNGASTNGSITNDNRVVATSNGNGSRTTADFAHTYSSDTSLNEVPSVDGEQCSFDFQARQSAAYGGDDTWISVPTTSVTFTQLVADCSDPSVSYATTASATADATLAVITPPTGCTTYYRRGAGSWTTSRVYSGTRGTSYTYQAKFINSNSAIEGANGQTVDTFPYRTPDRNVSIDLRQNGGGSIPGNAIDGTANVDLSLTGMGAYDDYKVVARAASTNGTVANAEFVGHNLGDGSRTTGTIAFPAADCPTIDGETAYYKVQTRRDVDVGGDGNYVDADNGTYEFNATQLVRDAVGPWNDPTYATTESSSTTATVAVKSAPIPELEVIYSDDNVNFQTSRVFSGKTRGTSYDYYFKYRNINSGSASGSASYSISDAPPYLAPDTTVSVTGYDQGGSVASNQIDGTSSLDIQFSGGSAACEYRYYLTQNTSNGSLTAGNVSGAFAGNTDITVTTAKLPQVDGERADYKIQARRPVAGGGNNSWEDTNAAEWFFIKFYSLPTTPVVSYATTASATTTATITPQTPPTGSDVLYQLDSNPSTASNDFSVTRGTSYDYGVWWYNSLSGAYAGPTTLDNQVAPYKTPDLNITINDPQAGFPLGNTDTSNKTLTITGGGVNTTYRAQAINTPDAPSTGTIGVGTVVGSGDITISYPSEQPVSGESITYKVQGKITTALGGSDTYSDTGDTFTLERQGYVSYRMGGTTVTSGGSNGGPITITGPGYVSTFDVDATVDGTYGDGVTTVRVNEDHDENGSWANAGLTGTTSGTGTSVATFYGDFYFLANGLTGHTSNTYRYKGYQVSGEGVEGGSPAIDYQFSGDGTGVTPATQDTQTQSFSVTVTNTSTDFDYLISDSGTGDAGGGLWMAAQAQPSGVMSIVKQGTAGGNLSFGPSDGALTNGLTKTYYVWIRRRTNTDNTWYVTSASFDVTKTYEIVMGTTTISPNSDEGGGTTVTISGSATIGTGTITGLNIIDVNGNAPTLSAPSNTGLNTGSATVSRTFTSVDLNRTYVFKATAIDNLGGSEDSNEVTFVSTKSGGSTTPPGGSGNYGLEIRNSSNRVVWDATSRVARHFAAGNGLLTQGSNEVDSIFIDGLSTSSEFTVVLANLADANASDAFVQLDYSITTDYLTVTGDFSNTSAPICNYYYWIFKS